MNMHQKSREKTPLKLHCWHSI